MIGLVCSQVFDHVTSDDVMSALEQVKQHLAAYLTSQAAVQRIVALVILSSWWENTAVSGNECFVLKFFCDKR